jgi:type IV pilus assembly protein PilF
MLRKVLAFIAMGYLICSLSACGGSRRDENRPNLQAQDKLSAAELNVRLGQGYLQQNRLELALDKLKKAIVLDPKLPSAHTVIAVLYERINDLENARLHYKRAVDLSPRAGSVLNNYGTFLCRQGEYELADRLFEKALADPFYETPAVAHGNRGQCAVDWGKLDLAEDQLRQSIQKNPSGAAGLLALAHVYLIKKDYMKGRAFIQRYEAEEKPSAEGLKLALEIERGVGNTAAINEYKNRLLSEFPNSPEAKQLEGEGG